MVVVVVVVVLTVDAFDGDGTLVQVEQLGVMGFFVIVSW